MSDEKPDQVETTEHATAEAIAAATDPKAKFKAALDAKNAKSRAASGGEGGEAGSQIKGASTSGPTQRMFRRKAGG